MEKIIAAVGSLDAIRHSTYDDFLAINSIGEIIADTLVKTLQKKAGLIDELLEHTEIEEAEKPSGNLEGKKFLLTGSLSQSRKHFETLIKENGGTISSSVGSIDYLLAGENAGSKLAKAKTAGKTIITEELLMEMIG